MDILKEIGEWKKKDIQSLPDVSEYLPKSDRDFLSSLSERKSIPHLIAEIKPASPVSGRILPKTIDIPSLALDFEKSGASALSVLTEDKYFQGSFASLQKIKKATNHVPVLCKDFILSEKQIRYARKNGADSFLLIVKILSVFDLQRYINYGRSFQMEPLVEIADTEDLKKVLLTDAKIIGINNRDLSDFSLSISRTYSLAKKIPPEKIIVSLSGFFGSDVRLVRNTANAVLVGSSIGKALNASFPHLDNNCIKKLLSSFIHPKPLVKLCGIRTKKDLQLCKKINIPLLGLNFVSSSKRFIDPSVAEYITGKEKDDKYRRGRIKLVGVFQNHSREYIKNISDKYNLDFVQLSGKELAKDFLNFHIPVVKGISIDESFSCKEEIEEWKHVADIFLFDGKIPGSGKSWLEEHSHIFQTLSLKKPFLIAGGVCYKNAKAYLKRTNADGIDLASSIEDEKGEWSFEKINRMQQLFPWT